MAVSSVSIADSHFLLYGPIVPSLLDTGDCGTLHTLLYIFLAIVVRLLFGNATKGYRLYDATGGKILHNCDVQLNEQHSQNAQDTAKSDYQLIAEFSENEQTMMSLNLNKFRNQVLQHPQRSSNKCIKLLLEL